MIKLILKKTRNLERTRLPAVSACDSLLLFFFSPRFWANFSTLQPSIFHLFLWEDSPSVPAYCPPSPLRSSCPRHGSPPTCPFIFGTLFSLNAFSVSLQPVFVQSYCYFAEFDTPWYRCDFSSTALVQQEWTKPLAFISSCHFHFSLCVPASVFPTLFSSLSFLLSYSLFISLILNLSIFFHCPVCVPNDALFFFVHRELFHGWFVFIRVWMTLSFSSVSNESLYTFLFIFVVFFQTACSHYWVYL